MKRLFTAVCFPLTLLSSTFIPELWPQPARHSGGTACNEAHVLWTLRDRSELCGSCLVPRACHHSARVVFHNSTLQSNKLTPLTNSLTPSDVKSIVPLRSKSIVHQSIGFSVSKILEQAYHHMSAWNRTKSVLCFLYLGFCTEGFVLIWGGNCSRRLCRTSTNSTIYLALMGSIQTQAQGLGSGTGLYPYL